MGPLVEAEPPQVMRIEVHAGPFTQAITSFIRDTISSLAARCS